jgi:hypothetical protein
VNETLQYWQNHFQDASSVIKDNGGGLKLLEKTKPIIKIYGYEDIAPESITSTTLKRQIINKLQTNLVVFNDRIEIKCQIPVEADKSANVIMTLGLD